MEETYSSEFESFLKTVEILYVEDEDTIRELLCARLSRQFGKIHVAQNGEVGLYQFEAHRPRIVVTDIRMPIMDGLDMLRSIKEKSPQTRAIVTTAHSDSEFMMKSIEIGIDRYIIKPINVEQLISAIKKICFQLYNEYRSVESQRNLVTKEHNAFVVDIFETMSSSLPNPIIVYRDTTFLFMNKAFSALFDARTIDLLQNGDMSLENLCIPDNRQKITVTLPSGRKKIPAMYKTVIEHDNEQPVVMYSFNDLTLYEYKNEKLKSYADILYEILKVRHKNISKPLSPTPSQEKPEKITEENTHILSDMLDNEEMEALRRNHFSKYTATEYVASIEHETLEELDELEEIEREITELLEQLDSDGNLQTHANEIGNKFLAYASTIKLLIEFEDLASAVQHFGSFLSHIADKQHIEWSRLVLYIQNIRLDLVSWRTTIFVRHETQDIHYLDSSLMSSCIQAELDCVHTDKHLDDSNDLELF